MPRDELCLPILIGLLAAGAARAQPVEPVPLVLVHGIDGTTEEPARLARRLARGRPVLEEVHAAEAEALAPGSLPRDAIVCFGYYREARGAPRFYADQRPALASIGGCPVPRSDPDAARYSISYAAQLARAIEAICRASGVEQVDLVGFSMGGIVARAYTRWLSLRGPNGASRVRRVMTVASPNHGVNVLEASLYAWSALRGERASAIAGELAELEADCRWWSGRAYTERLNEGWDGFCRARGIEYAAGAARGGAWQHDLRALAPWLGFLFGWLRPPLLVHDPRGLDVTRAFLQGAEDGDGAVRWSSARLDPARYPGVLWNATWRGVHSDPGAIERAPMEGTFAQALVRAFAFERRFVPGFAARAARLSVVDAHDEGSWLLLELDLGGTPLAARVELRGGGPGPLARARDHALLLRQGPQRLALYPDEEGEQTVRVSLSGLDGEAELPPLRARLRRGRLPAPRPVPLLEAPLQVAGGALLFPLGAGGALPFEVAVGLDAGAGPVWTAWQGARAALVPRLLPGRWEVLLRVRAAANGAGEWVEADRPDALRLMVEPGGGWSVAR